MTFPFQPFILTGTPREIGEQFAQMRRAQFHTVPTIRESGNCNPTSRLNDRKERSREATQEENDVTRDGSLGTLKDGALPVGKDHGRPIAWDGRAAGEEDGDGFAIEVRP